MPKPYTPNDAWSKKAREEGYRARSIYKLREIDEKFHILAPGQTVIDLGAAPGSWLQYASEKAIGGRIIGLDLSSIEPIEGVETFVANITDREAVEKIIPSAVDVVLSDLAPATSGTWDVDQWRSIELSEAVVAIAEKHLRPKGWCILKVFRGEDFDPFVKKLRVAWPFLKIVQAEASRDRSKEIYVVLRKR